MPGGQGDDVCCARTTATLSRGSHKLWTAHLNEWRGRIYLQRTVTRAGWHNFDVSASRWNSHWSEPAYVFPPKATPPALLHPSGGACREHRELPGHRHHLPAARDLDEQPGAAGPSCVAGAAVGYSAGEDAGLVLGEVPAVGGYGLMVTPRRGVCSSI